MLQDPSPKSWRHRLRFSVRGLVILVLVVGAGLGWIVHKAHVQRDSVAAIQRAGGTVFYDWQFKNGRPVGNGKLWAPTWLVERIGADYFQSVTYVSLPDSRSVGTLVHIGSLDRLEMLMLGGPGLSDEELSHLQGLTNVQALFLSGANVSDSGLQCLKGLVKLKTLSLGGTKVTDAGIAQLRGLSSLEELDVSMTMVTDASLVHLRGLRSLKELNLQMTRITDAGLIHLRGLTNLRLLMLRSAKIARNSSLGELREALPKVQIDY